jgi:hypothetical protein
MIDSTIPEKRVEYYHLNNAVRTGLLVEYLERNFGSCLDGLSVSEDGAISGMSANLQEALKTDGALERAIIEAITAKNGEEDAPKDISFDFANGIAMDEAARETTRRILDNVKGDLFSQIGRHNKEYVYDSEIPEINSLPNSVKAGRIIHAESLSIRFDSEGGFFLSGRIGGAGELARVKGWLEDYVDMGIITDAMEFMLMAHQAEMGDADDHHHEASVEITREGVKMEVRSDEADEALMKEAEELGRAIGEGLARAWEESPQKLNTTGETTFRIGVNDEGKITLLSGVSDHPFVELFNRLMAEANLPGGEAEARQAIKEGEVTLPTDLERREERQRAFMPDPDADATHIMARERRDRDKAQGDDAVNEIYYGGELKPRWVEEENTIAIPKANGIEEATAGNGETKTFGKLLSEFSAGDSGQKQQLEKIKNMVRVNNARQGTLTDALRQLSSLLGQLHSADRVRGMSINVTVPGAA